MLGTRQLGSFSLAGGPVVLPGPSTLLWRETDAFIEAPNATDVDVVAPESDAMVVARESDAEVVHSDTDVDVYL
jgi:hypothetical protein